MEGDTTAFYIAKKLKHLGIRITTIARGIPVGGAALAGMLQVQIGEAGLLPPALTTALGKLAIAGKVEVAATAAPRIPTKSVSRFIPCFSESAFLSEVE